MPQSQRDSSSMDMTSAVDWRSQLQSEARQKIVNKIMETLKNHLPISFPEGLNELRKIAIRFEEKIYAAATSQSDYLRRISMKMLSMETKSQQSATINPTNAGVNQNPPDSGSLGIHSQINNPGQPRQLMQQNLLSNTSAAAQGSSGLAPALQSNSGLAQSNISGVTQASNLQNLPGKSQPSVNNAIGQGSQTDMYANAQRQRQQQIISQQQQSQNPMMYQHHLQQHLNKQMPQSSLLQPQPQPQQQLLPQSQLQPIQPSLMQIPSNLQSNQSNMQQTQAANTQSAPQPGFQQNQLNQIQQPIPSLLQQISQSVPRQQQVPSLQQQSASISQQSASISQQSTLSQQHQLMGQQGNTSNVQQSQLHGQQNSIGDIQQQQQQQRLPIQQNNLLSMQQQQQQQIMNQQALSLHQQQQQQLGSQNNMSGLQQTSNLQSNQRAMLLQKQQQQQAQHSSLSLLQSQGQQSQHQSSQQPLMSQFQSQPTQMQQQLLMQQTSSSLQRDMQQRLQGSGSLLQAHNAVEQKPLIQTQRGLQEVSSSTSADSTAQTGHAGAVDWQEECYQKVLSMRELYYADLNEFHHKINMKLQQQEVLVPPGKQSDQYEKLKGYNIMLDRMLQLLQIPSKSSIPFGLKEKLPMYEKQIINMVTSQRPKKIPQQGQGQQFQHPNVGNSHPVPHQQPSQVSQMQLTDNHANQVQQGPGTSLQSSGSSSVQHVSMPLSTTHQNISSGLPPGSTMDSVQGNSFNSRQPGAIGSGKHAGLGSLQNSMSMSQRNNVNALSQSAANPLQANVSPMQTTSSVLQQQNIKQEQQQPLQTQQMKQQLQQRHIRHQQTMQQQQRQQLLQHQQPLQQHLLQQQKQQQASQLPAHQIQQLHSMNELNELKARQGSGTKAGLYEYSPGQRHNYYNQQLKPGASYPVSSPQNLQASSPQISHQSSPQIDQNSLLSSISKAKAPMQSANSPLVVTPSTPFAPSPIPVDSEKPISATSSVGHVGHQQAPVALPQSHSLAVSTPGISASPLLAECTSQDGNQAIPATSNVTERPVDRLIKMVQTLTPKLLCSSISDIGSVVSMVDRIAGSAPGNGSRTAVGEDLVAMTKCRLQARNFMSQDGGATAKKMKRHTSAMPLNNASSAGSVNEGLMKLYGFESSELESTATSRIKRLKPEVNHALLEEIKEINQKLIDTVVDVSDGDADSVVAAAEGAEGTVVKCSYAAVALSRDLKAQFASAQMSPIMPMRLLVPANYPECSPLLLDNLPVEPREFEDLSSKAKSKFNISLRCLSQPVSLGEMVKTWDACARKVILEYAQQAGGGSFSSTYGSWEYCVGA